MNDKETHVVMDIREHCKEQMANEHVRDWGARRKLDLMLKTSNSWKKPHLNQNSSESMDGVAWPNIL